MSNQTQTNHLAYQLAANDERYAADLAAAFPEIDPLCRPPYGDRVLVQLRTAKRMSAGGIILTEESRETEQWNTQVAKVIELGSTAFCNQDTLEPWPEGAWCKPGEFVRVSKYGGDRWKEPVPGSDEREFAIFILIKDTDLLGAYPGDPLKAKAYID